MFTGNLLLSHWSRTVKFGPTLLVQTDARIVFVYSRCSPALPVKTSL